MHRFHRREPLLYLLQASSYSAITDTAWAFLDGIDTLDNAATTLITAADSSAFPNAELRDIAALLMLRTIVGLNTF